MSCSLFDFAVINLKERTDRWEKIINNFNSYKILKINAIKEEEGYIGCFKSHQRAILLAKQLKLKKIFVLEDDCIPCKNFESRFTIIKKYLESHSNWDLYLGGGIIKPEWSKGWENNFKGTFKFNYENFIEINKCYGLHFVCYNESVYDFFLNINIYDTPIDKIWWRNKKTIISYPFIGTQDEGYSDIQERCTSTKGKTKHSQEYLKKFIYFK